MYNCREVVPYNVKAMADNFHANSLEKTLTIQAMSLLLCVSDKTDIPSELNADNFPDNSKYIPKPHNYDFVLGSRKNIGWNENRYIVYK